ncbi:MAG: hypothetical protein A3K19_25590 [Lentisphaerae bacterium RIFOXYB12_FULL_65_16]|nr:MAG: hypothetical protein A3K18_29600 [Lentisphaerae bacterium RIFOXYA12_64_32]OGV84864.1 MAG: hypothetical protein A3K19_25590 [Lentisphaerae bacterium RIFOXYB12_FULL_65_16]
MDITRDTRKTQPHADATVSLKGLVTALLLAASHGLTADFPVPDTGPAPLLWQAEDAVRVGVWQQTDHAWADHGAYVAPSGWTPEATSSLQFEFELERPCTLQFLPVWWRHGEQKPAQRFPHPLPRSVGPSAVAAATGSLFFTAPAAGRVGVLDVTTNRVSAPIETGGYPLDLAATPGGGTVYVADPAQNKLHVIDAESRRCVGSINVNGMPWSVDCAEGRVFAACLRDKCLAVVDPAAGTETQRIPLGAPGLRVRRQGTSLIVTRAALVLKTGSLEEEPPDRFDYFTPGRTVAGWPNPIPTENAERQPSKTFDAPTPHGIRARASKKSLDVREVTESATPATPPTPLQPTPGPVALDELGVTLVFAAPLAGRLGFLNMETETLDGQLDVGGYPVDLITDPERGRVYVADAAGNQVLVVDVENRKVTGAVATPELPVYLALHDGLLYVACRRGKCLAVLDVVAQRQMRSVPLPDEPLEVHVVRLYPESTFFAAGRWPWTYYLPPDSEAPYRVLVRMAPQLAVDPRTLEVSAAAVSSGPDPHLEATVIVPVTSRNVAEPDAGLVARWGTWQDRDAAAACREQTGSIGTGAATAVTVVDDPFFGPTPAFDGRRAKAEWPHSPALMPESGFTVDAWIKWDGPGSSNPEGRPDPSSCVIAKRGPNAGYMLMVRNDGVVFLNLNGVNEQKDTDRGYVYSKARVPRGRWAHVAGVYDPAGPKFGVFVDGVAETSTPPQPLHPSTTPLGIGSQPGCYWFKGQIAQARLWSRALGASEVAALYEARVPEKTLSFHAEDNSSVLCRTDGSWLDVGSVCDPQLDPNSAQLGPNDAPGTVTFAMDDGPPHDWSRDLWLTPDNELFLVAGTDEFRRWNAVPFRLEAGRHRLSVQAHSRYACLDAIAVIPTLDGRLEVQLLPEPRDRHTAVPLPSYHGVFYDQEPVQFTVELRNTSQTPMLTNGGCEVRNFLGETVFSEKLTINLAPGGEHHSTLAPVLNEWGVFSLRVTMASEHGTLERQCVFLRLPKLEHPRLLWRADEEAAIRARVAAHPRLFERYAQWLLRNHEAEDFLPSTLLARYPSESPYFDILGKWRVIGCSFALTFLNDTPGVERLTGSVLRLLEKGRADQHTFVHNWLRGALPFLYDTAVARTPELRAQVETLYPNAWEDLDRREENLLALREPLTPGMRASLFQQATWLMNVDRYFMAHAGAHGGDYYQSMHSFCICPIFGTLGAHTLYRNVFGMPRLFERPHFQGWFTHYRYAAPPFGENPCCVKGTVTSGGPHTGRDQVMVSTMIRAVSGLARHPLEKHLDDWDQTLTALDGASTLTDAEVDKLFDGAGVCLPLYLAWGWYEPLAPAVPFVALPPAALFDGEGHVSMRGSWANDATHLLFVCGARDCSPRFQPGHLRLSRGDDTLLAAPSARRGDHGQPVPTWGNTVVVGDDWMPWWMRAVGHPRGMTERRVVNRYAPEVKVYEQRNRAFTTGRIPAEVKDQRYYTLSFHEHVQNPYVREADIVAYETHPAFDYAAGDMTNAWPCADVAEAGRQVVFLRPDTVVVYDRMTCPGPTRPVRWLAATVGKLQAEGKAFRVESGKSALSARVLLPPDAQTSAGNVRDFGESLSMPVVIITQEPAHGSAEYLVVLRTGAAADQIPLDVQALPGANADETGVRIALTDGTAELFFHRTGPPGGRLALSSAGTTTQHDLGQCPDDSYRHWEKDPRYSKWLQADEFRFLHAKP